MKPGNKYSPEKITELMENPSLAENADDLSVYLAAECLANKKTPTLKIIKELKTSHPYAWLNEKMLYNEMLFKFRKNAKVIVNSMLEYQLGEGHKYVEPIFRLKKEENTLSQEHSEEKWEAISDIKDHLLNSSPNKIFLFIADSGIGKTTLLWWLNKYILESFEDKVPIYVHSKDLKNADWNIRLINKLKTKIVEPESISNRFFLDADDESLQSFIKTAEDNENLILLIDGLNESRSEDFDLAVNNKFVNNSKMLATREEYVDEFKISCPNVEKIYISPFNTENISEYLGRDYNNLKSKINEHKELFQIPIVLRFAYHIYQSTGKLDFENKFDLYSQVIEEAMEKQLKLSGVVPFCQLIEALKYISFKALKKGIINRIDEKDKHKHFLAKAIEEYGEINPCFKNVKDVIDAFRAHDSIFGIFTHQEGIFEYYHQSFQEYFAASYLKEQSVNEIKKYLYHPLFKEMLIFLGGGLELSKAKELIEFLICDVHEDLEKKKIKELTWQNIEIASWLIKEAREKDKLIEIFYNKCRKKRISFKQYLDSEFHLKKIIKIIENLYSLKLSIMGIATKEYLNMQTFNLLMERKHRSIDYKQEIIKKMQDDFNIEEQTINFIMDNNLHNYRKDLLKNYAIKQAFSENGLIRKDIIQWLQNDSEVKCVWVNYEIDKLYYEINLGIDVLISPSVIMGLKNNDRMGNTSKDFDIKKSFYERILLLWKAIGDAKQRGVQNEFEWQKRLTWLMNRLFGKNSTLNVIAMNIVNLQLQSQYEVEVLKETIITNLFREEIWFHELAIDIVMKLGLQNYPDIKEQVKDTITKKLIDEDSHNRMEAINVVMELRLQDELDVKKQLRHAIIENLCVKENRIRQQAIDTSIKLGMQNDSEVKIKLYNSVIKNLFLVNSHDKAMNAVINLKLINDSNIKEQLKRTIIKNLRDEESWIRMRAIDTAIKLEMQNDSEVKIKLYNSVIKDLFNRDVCMEVIDIVLKPILQKELVIKGQLKNILVKKLCDKNSWIRMRAIDTAIKLGMQNDSEVKIKLYNSVIKNLFNRARELLPIEVDIIIKLDLTVFVKSKLLKKIKRGNMFKLRKKSYLLKSLEKLNLETEKIDIVK